MSKKEAVFPKGIRLFEPHKAAPYFVKASVVVSLNELIKFGKENPDFLSEYKGEKQLKLQLLESKKGTLYLTVDTYKAEPKPEPEIEDDDDENDLPF